MAYHWRCLFDAALFALLQQELAVRSHRQACFNAIDVAPCDHHRYPTETRGDFRAQLRVTSPALTTDERQSRPPRGKGWLEQAGDKKRAQIYEKPVCLTIVSLLVGYFCLKIESISQQEKEYDRRWRYKLAKGGNDNDDGARERRGGHRPRARQMPCSIWTTKPNDEFHSKRPEPQPAFVSSGK